MSLKLYLRQTIDEVIKKYSSKIDSARKSLKILEETETDNAEYVVSLRSLWEDTGEKSTMTIRQGTLKEAVEQAEAEFKSKNDRQDVQALCAVAIRLGNNEYPVHEKYWEKFREAYKKTYKKILHK